jgi:hypothetical protein
MGLFRSPRIDVGPPPEPTVSPAQIAADDDEARLAAIRRALNRNRQRPSLIIDPATSTGSSMNTGIRIE